MLEIKAGNNWQWYARGKHPSAKDFFVLGQEQPVFSAFYDWVEKGYGVVSSREMENVGACFWRFWARGQRKHALVCGILRDSCDLLGRDFPLLVMGTGVVRGWDDHWDLLPFACEKTWSDMEYVTAKRHKSLEGFKYDFGMFRPPESRWASLAARREGSGDIEERSPTFPPDTERIPPAKGDKFAFEERRIVIPLEEREDLTGDVLTKVNSLHYYLRKDLGVVPMVVFMGGKPEKNYLLAYVSGLTLEDFTSLWTL